MEKALGMIWDVEADVFRSRIAEMKKVNTSRRGLLSLISSMYDPFGFVLQRCYQSSKLYNAFAKLDMNGTKSYLKLN